MLISAKVKKYLLIGLSYLLIFFVISQGVSWWKTRNAQTGNLSEFNVELMDGSQFIISELSGKPVLFHFWATWCPLCDLQKGSVESIARDYPVVSVASWSEGEAEVKKYMRDNELTFPVMLDDSGKLAESFGLKGVPTSFILSPSGEIEYVETGYTTEAGLRFRLWLSTLIK
ncbi:MAG: protein disulfide oxidoreductase [Gammaproteobacteria bacterium]